MPHFGFKTKVAGVREMTLRELNEYQLLIPPWQEKWRKGLGWKKMSIKGLDFDGGGILLMWYAV